MMASPDLKTFEELVTLSSLAVDALTRWDDVTDKLDDNPALLTALEISQAEVDQVSNFLRKVTVRCMTAKPTSFLGSGTTFASNSCKW